MEENKRTKKSGNGTTWMNTAVLVTCIRNFYRNRGPVSGILKGYVGLSTAIFTDLYSALFADDPTSFPVMLALVPFVVCLSGIFFLREIPPTVAQKDDQDSSYFRVFNAIAVVVALYPLAFGFLPNPSALASGAFAVVLVVLLAAPLGIPVYSYLKSRGLKAGVDVEEALLVENVKGNESELEFLPRVSAPWRVCVHYVEQDELVYVERVSILHRLLGESM